MQRIKSNLMKFSLIRYTSTIPAHNIRLEKAQHRVQTWSELIHSEETVSTLTSMMILTPQVTALPCLIGRLLVTSDSSWTHGEFEKSSFILSEKVLTCPPLPVTENQSKDSWLWNKCIEFVHITDGLLFNWYFPAGPPTPGHTASVLHPGSPPRMFTL